MNYRLFRSMKYAEFKTLHLLQRKSFWLLIFCLFWNFFTAAQNSDTLKIKKNLIFAGYSQFGKVLATNPFLKPTDPIFDHDYDFTALSFQLTKQTTGENLWEKNYGYPSYGLGIYSATFLNTSKLGTPVAVYAVFKTPFKRWNRFNLNFEGGIGITFNWEGYNPLENSYNISMGSNQSVFIDLGMVFSYPVSSHFDLGVGYSFTHFSNGAMKTPNFGLNTFAPKISLNYNINRFVPPAAKEKLPVYKQNTCLDFSLFGGMKNVAYKGNDVDSITKYKGVNYSVYGINLLLNHQFSYKSKIGIGLSMGYDGSYNSTVLVENGELEPVEGFHGSKLTLSFFPSYELVINKLSIVVQPGFYLFRKASIIHKPMAYQRLGLHYRINKKLFAGVCLRAYDYHVSDFIEWTLGYHLSINKKEG